MNAPLYQFKPPFDWLTHFTDGVHGRHYIVDANETTVCKIQHDDRINPESVDRVVALFAAAPDLLTALEALTEWGCTHTSPRDANSPHELLIAARAAIAKTALP